MTPVQCISISGYYFIPDSVKYTFRNVSPTQQFAVDLFPHTGQNRGPIGAHSWSPVFQAFNGQQQERRQLTRGRSIRLSEALCVPRASSQCIFFLFHFISEMRTSGAWGTHSTDQGDPVLSRKVSISITLGEKVKKESDKNELRLRHAAAGIMWWLWF